MKDITRIFTAVLLLTTLSACKKEAELQECMTLKIKASVTETKTYLSNGHHRWVSGDLLRVLSEDGVCIKSDACQNESTSCNFIIKGWPSDKIPAYAVYCGQNNVSVEPKVEGSVITARLDNVQKITHRNSFSTVANLSVGKISSVSSSTYDVDMKNVCGLLKFRFSKYDDIKTITIRDLDSKPLAGTVEVSFDAEGNPYVNNVLDAEPVLSVSASGKTNTLGNTEHAELPAGQDYYVCLLPGTYRLKIILTRISGEEFSLVPKIIY